MFYRTNQFQAVIFDLDGVITDTAEFHYLAWKQLGKALGISFNREFNEQLKGVGRMDSLESILALDNRQNDFTLEEKQVLATRKNNYYVELIKKISPNDLLPGIEELLKQLKTAEFKIGMASASKNAFAVTNSLKIRDYDHIVDVATVANSKPHPEVFLKAAEAVGVVPENCIGIEDAAAGVTAINDAGMFSIAVGVGSGLNHANLILPSTDKLTIDIIEKLGGESMDYNYNFKDV